MHTNPTELPGNGNGQSCSHDNSWRRRHQTPLRRGDGSAAMLIVQEDGGVWLNNDVVLRPQIDDHEEPITELRRLVEIAGARLERRRSRVGVS